MNNIFTEYNSFYIISDNFAEKARISKTAGRKIGAKSNNLHVLLLWENNSDNLLIFGLHKININQM